MFAALENMVVQEGGRSRRRRRRMRGGDGENCHRDGTPTEGPFDGKLSGEGDSQTCTGGRRRRRRGGTRRRRMRGGKRTRRR